MENTVLPPKSAVNYCPVRRLSATNKPFLDFIFRFAFKIVYTDWYRRGRSLSSRGSSRIELDKNRPEKKRFEFLRF